MIAVPALVQQHCGKRSYIHQHDVDISVIVDIAEGSSTAAFLRNSGQRAGDILKGSVAAVAEELNRLAICQSARDRIHLWIHMAVGDENIQPTIVVHIEEGGAPTHLEESGLGQLGGIAYVRKTVCSQVAVQSVGLFVEVGYKHG